MKLVIIFIILSIFFGFLGLMVILNIDSLEDIIILFQKHYAKKVMNSNGKNKEKFLAKIEKINSRLKLDYQITGNNGWYKIIKYDEKTNSFITERVDGRK